MDFGRDKLKQSNRRAKTTEHKQEQQRNRTQTEKNKKRGEKRMEETKNLNDIIKQIDTENDYNTTETLENYFYSNYIVEY